MTQHHFDVEIAKQYGLNAAILLDHLHFWVTKNEANEANFFDGRFWTFNTVKAFETLFPYMTPSAIKRALKGLEDDGLVVTGNYNKSAYDRTKWYALTDAAYGLFKSGASICQNPQMEERETANGFGQNSQPIPDRKPDTKPSKNTDRTRRRHGEYSNVLLTDEDLEKLKTEFPTDWEGRIERLSAYMASTGKGYKNHLATIRNWARMDREKGKAPKQEYKPEDQEQWPGFGEYW